jgi:hypothetical protein
MEHFRHRPDRLTDGHLRILDRRRLSGLVIAAGRWLGGGHVDREHQAAATAVTRRVGQAGLENPAQVEQETGELVVG